MLFKPIYDLQHLKYLNKKNLSYHQNLDYLFNIMDNIKDGLRWDYVSMNENALDILYANTDKIDYATLCFNKNPLATDIIKKRISEDKFNEFWDFMAGSDTKIDIIFPLCYLVMRDNMTEFNQELCKYVFNPIRLKRMSTTYGIELEEWQEIY